MIIKIKQDHKIMVTLGLTIMIVFLSDMIVTAGEKENTRVTNSIEVLNDMMNMPESAIPPSLIDNAYGVAIVPGLIKIGLWVGGRYGLGVLMIKDDDGKWSKPCFISITGGSFGWQIGAQSTDVVLVFKTKKSVDAITEGKFTLGADAAIAAGPIGRHAAAGTDIELKSEIYSYSRTRGLFAGIALEGASMQIDHDANGDFYNRKHIMPREIFYTNAVTYVPELARKMIETITKYTNKK